MPVDDRPAKLSIDFSGVEIRKGGGSDHIPEGDYLVEVVDIKRMPLKDNPADKLLLWSFAVVEPRKYAGKKLINRTVLRPESLWALRSLLVDMLGEDKVPQRMIEIPLAKIAAAKKQVGVSVEDDEYKGKLKSKITGTFSVADWKAREIVEDTESDDSDDDDEDVKSKSVSSDDDEDMDEIDVDDI